MRNVRRVATAPETVVVSAVRTLGHRYRRNVKGLPGAPDVANVSRKWAIFVNGCFWHHHRACRRGTMPKRNFDFWTTKFKVNRQRDAWAIRTLRKSGFCVLVVWECETTRPDQLIAKIACRLRPRA
ncbi:MAG TPA: DNA mismatch endonuclease Vsr [Hyphomicrobium sp.]|nr:DNA mismatch endonuclease Vsr [Hyphomicrobium sp.]